MKKFYRLILAICAVALFIATTPGYAQPGWTEDVSNPIFGEGTSPTGPKAYYPNVVYDASSFGGAYTYKMWYGTSSGQTGLAYSNDGTTWIDQGVVMAVGYHAQVIYEASGFGGSIYYKMWYWDSGSLYGVGAIRYTESTDGITWTNDQPSQNGATGVPFIAASGWNSGSYGPSTILYNTTATNTGPNPFDYSYAMYFIGNPAGNGMTGLAYSSDGITWNGYDSTSDGNADPVLVGGESWASYAEGWTILMNAPNDFEMWYSGGVNYSNHGIGYATSTDGLVWVKDASNPIFYKDDGIAWRDSRSYTPSVIKDGANYKMWFTGKDIANGDYSLGYATWTPTSVVWVDDDYTPTSSGGHIWGYDAFDNIQAGIAATAPGGTLYVYDGTYNETGQIVISKDVTIIGDYSAKGTTTITPTGDTGNAGDARGWFLVNDGIEFNLSYVTLDGSGFLVYQGIRNKGFGTFDNVTFYQIKYNESGPEYSGVAIAAFGGADLNVHVTNSHFSDIGRVGVLYFGARITGSNFTGNTYIGKGPGVWLDYALDISAGAIVTVDDCEISNCEGFVDPWTSAGVLVTDLYGPGTTANVVNSTFTNNTAGIAVGYDETDTPICTAYGNSFLGTGYGITQIGVNTVDAENNYWGTIVASEVLAKTDGLVDYSPWCNSTFTNCSLVGPGPITTIPDVAIECASDAIAVPVTVTDFNNVGAISLVINYNNTNLHIDPIPNPPDPPWDIVFNTALSGATYNILPNGIITISYFSSTGINLTDGETLFTMNFDYIGGDQCPNGIVSDLTWINSDPTYLEYATPDGFAYDDDPFGTFYFEGSVHLEHTTIPAEVGGPVATSSTVECVVAATAPTTLPVGEDICGNVLSPAAAVKHSLFVEDFSTAVTIGATQAPDVWYVDRYAPAGFVSPVVFDGDDRLKHSIAAADFQGDGSFYNTQGRKYDLGTATDYMEIELYIPAAWETSNKREAGLWGTAFDVSNVISGYPIVEFTSDDNNPRFHYYETGVGYWVDMGLPTGFTYDSWVTLSIKVLTSGEFYASAGDLTYNSVTSTGDASIRLGNVILQGHNYDPAVPGVGVTYDIYWDNFKWNDTYAEPACEGYITYTYDYEDCSGLIFPWMYTYTIEHSTLPVVPVDGGSTVYDYADALIVPTPPVVTDVCGVNIPAVLISAVDNPNPFTYPGTRTYTYTYTDCVGLESTWNYVYTIPGVEISGVLTYYNNANTPMVGEVVKLFQGTTEKYSATTIAGGAFAFNNVAPGIYDVVITKTGDNGGINSTDAAQVNYWGVTPSTIEMVRFNAGDVTGNLSVNGTDAGLIQQYFLTLGTPTPAFASVWEFWNVNELIVANPSAGGYPQITVDGAAPSITHNMYALVTGDFNRSFTPAAKATASETLTLEYGETIEVGSTEFELPLYAGIDMEVGAISLILNIPSDMVEVQDVYLGNDPTIQVLYSVIGDELRISWQSTNPISLQKGDALLTMKLELTSLTGESIQLSLVADPLNELANNSYEVINNAVLVVDIIHTMTLGMSDFGFSDELSLGSQPNPFQQSTNFVYSLPINGKVTLEVYDLLGNKVRTLVDEAQDIGEHQMKLDANILRPGIYMAILKVQNSETVLTRTIKIISKQ